MGSSPSDKLGPTVIRLPGALSSTPATLQNSEDMASHKVWSRALKATSELGEHSLATLPTVVENIAARLCAAPAALSQSMRLSFQQLSELSNRYARWAIAEGVQIGDVIGLMASNTPEYIAIWLGITRVGGVIAVLDPSHSAWTLARCIRMVAPKHIIMDAAVLANDNGLGQHGHFSAKVWALGENVDGLGRIDQAVQSYASERLGDEERRPITLAHRALHIYTCGASGVPRAANVSHHRVMTWCRWFAAILNLRPVDRLYHCLALSRGIAGIAVPGAVLVSGASIFMREEPTLCDFWGDVRESGSTLLQYDRELCRGLLDAAPSSDERSHGLRVCCGNGIGADVWNEFKERFHIPSVLEFYVPAEGIFSLYNIDERVGSVGRAPPYPSRHFPVALVKLDEQQEEPLRNVRGHCLKVAVNELGEALARVDPSAGILGRYEGYVSEEDTESNILRNVFAPGDVWFRSGDLMSVDAQGYFHFIDRINDIITSKGKVLTTSEISGLLSRCEGVRRTLVYAVALPQFDGRVAMAAIDVDEMFDLTIFRSQLEATLPEFARPILLRLRGQIKMRGAPRPPRSVCIAEAFDPAHVSDPLFFDDRQLGAYVPLDAARFVRLTADNAPLGES